MAASCARGLNLGGDASGVHLPLREGPPPRPRAVWARDHAGLLARRFEVGGLTYSLRDQEGLQLSFDFPRDGSAVAEVPLAD